MNSDSSASSIQRPTARSTTAWRAAAVAVAAALVAVVLVTIVRVPTRLAVYVLVGAVWAGTAIAVARSSAIRNLALALMTLLVCIGAAELFCFFAIRAKPQAVAKPTYYRTDPQLGYGARPNTVAREREYYRGKLLYDVDYRIDSDGLRDIPQDVQGGPATAVFFGGSFMFGHGVNDNQTLPYYFLKAAGGSWHGYNFAFEGYGPHQMLRQLETGQVFRIAGRPALAVYEGIGDAVRRAAGGAYWDPFGPKYALAAGGEVRYLGPFHGPGYQRIRWLMRESFAFRYLKTHLRSAITPADLALYVAIVQQAQRLIDTGTGAKFVVIFWDNTPTASRIADRLAASHLDVIRVSSIIPDFTTHPLRYALSRFDRHPNALADRLIGSYLARHFAAPKRPAASSRPTKSG